MSEIINVIHPYVGPVDKREVLRYAGVRGTADEKTEELFNECFSLVDGKFKYALCYKRFFVVQNEDSYDLGFASVNSALVKKRLEGCSEIVLFAATVGIETDRLIWRYSSISPARAHMIQSIGAERIEALCDTFEDILKADGVDICPRFSAGYGDLPIELQKDIFKALDCPKNIGLTLNESLLMSPTKSVTAIIGIKRGSK